MDHVTKRFLPDPKEETDSRVRNPRSSPSHRARQNIVSVLLGKIYFLIIILMLSCNRKIIINKLSTINTYQQRRKKKVAKKKEETP
jgi:hypothetical protein